MICLLNKDSFVWIIQFTTRNHLGSWLYEFLDYKMDKGDDEWEDERLSECPQLDSNPYIGVIDELFKDIEQDKIDDKSWDA